MKSFDIKIGDHATGATICAASYVHGDVTGFDDDFAFLAAARGGEYRVWRRSLSPYNEEDFARWTRRA
jgi:hypothetical protein